MGYHLSYCMTLFLSHRWMIERWCLGLFRLKDTQLSSRNPGIMSHRYKSINAKKLINAKQIFQNEAIEHTYRARSQQRSWNDKTFSDCSRQKYSSGDATKPVERIAHACILDGQKLLFKSFTQSSDLPV